MNSFWAWFIGEAGAGWIFGILGIIGAIYTWRNRDRPPYVIIQETRLSQLLRVHPSQKENLEIYYSPSPNDKYPIQDLIQKEIVIYNSGTKDIAEEIQIGLRISFPDLKDSSKQSPAFKLFFVGSEVKYKLDLDKDSIKTTLRIPYLNSYPIHKSYISGFLISDEEFQIKLDKNFGKGWSARFISRDQFRRLLYKIEGSFDRLFWFFYILVMLYVIFLAVGFFFGAIGKAQLYPTDANIQLALQEYKEQLEYRQNFSFIQKLMNLSVGYPQNSSLPILIFLLLSLLPYARGKLFKWVIHTYLGIEPVERFPPKN